MAGLGYDGWVEASGQHQKFSNGIRLVLSLSYFALLTNPLEAGAQLPTFPKESTGLIFWGAVQEDQRRKGGL
jgi:hypothetical protein